MFMKSLFLKLGSSFALRILMFVSLAGGAFAALPPSYDNDAQTWKFAAPGTGVSLTFTTGAGSNQVLFVAVRAEFPLLATATFGAQNMTLLRRDASINSDELSVFYLV